MFNFLRKSSVGGFFPVLFSNDLHSVIVPMKIIIIKTDDNAYRKFIVPTTNSPFKYHIYRHKRKQTDAITGVPNAVLLICL